ncbi:unannotated protein [freshwater metagenome]|uniref:Unannotated protein n=1 Tax=freshwater metagenome TaxID=449393 RepID=A0A6J7MDG2_9ZZZZ
MAVVADGEIDTFASKRATAITSAKVTPLTSSETSFFLFINLDSVTTAPYLFY